MQTIALTGAALYTPEKHFPRGAVLIRGQEILWAGPADQCPPADRYFNLAPGLMITPGLLDLHTHGYGGLDPSREPAVLERLSTLLAGLGITGFLVTTMTAPLERLADTLHAVHRYLSRKLPGAEPLGIHLEGPFINPSYAGAHNAAYTRLPAVDDLKRLLQDGGPLALLTLAPELPGALELIQYASSQGVVTGAGHSAASYEETLAAVEAGLTYVTHTFNRMAPLHQRAPGLVGAALTDSRLRLEAIADGVHLHPAVINILVGLAAERLVLVSDNAPQAGLPPGEYGKARVDRLAVWNTTGNLIGSIIPLSRMVLLVRHITGLPLEKVLPMATSHPAQVLGLRHLGRLAPGCRADLVVFDREMTPQLTLVKGKKVYPPDPPSPAKPSPT